MAERGAGGKRSGVILMILAFVTIGGFLYWLNVSAEPTSVAIEEARDTTSEDPMVPTVALNTFANNPMEYENERIRLRDLEVASTLGPEAFWFQLPSEDPYLVKLDSTLVAMGTQVSSGDVAQRIEGRVHAMSDSVLDAWEAQGAFTNETHRLEAEYATSFIQATVVQLGSGSGSGSKGGGDGSGGGGGGS